MPFTVLSYTHEEVALGAALLPVRLSEKLIDRLWEIIQTGKPVSETCQVQIYSLNITLNKAAFEGLRARFGGEPMLFMLLNDCAVRAFEHFKIPIEPVGTVELLPQGVAGLLNYKLAMT
jgi:hypothetical protein